MEDSITMAEKNTIRKKILGDLPYQPALLREIRNYYRGKYELVSKNAGINDNFIQCHHAGDKDSYRCLLIEKYLKDIGRKIYQEIYRMENQGEWKTTLTIFEKFSKKNDDGTFINDDLYIKSGDFTPTKDMSIKYKDK